jgi:hypothetical protein
MTKEVRSSNKQPGWHGGHLEILWGVFSKWEILDCGGKRSATPLWNKIAP